jgi:hypothetical protein
MKIIIKCRSAEIDPYFGEPDESRQMKITLHDVYTSEIVKAVEDYFDILRWIPDDVIRDYIGKKVIPSVTSVSSVAKNQENTP